MGPRDYRYVRPLTSVAESLIEVYRNAEGRWMFGLKPIDFMMRGVGRGELCYVTGRTHSGKTQAVLHGIIHNLDRPQVLFTPDETSELVLAKLVSWMTDSNAERIEGLVHAGDAQAIAKIRRIAVELLPNLLVIDNVQDLGAAEKAMHEAEDHFGHPVQAVVLDYLALFGSGDGEFGDVAAKSREVKRWVKDIDLPGIVIHQGTRTNAGKGQALGLEAMSHAGENEAIFVVGVRRKRDDEKLEDFERAKHENTVTVNVIKNKRPPSKRGEHTFYLDPASGRIRELTAEDEGRAKHDPAPPPAASGIVNEPIPGRW